MAFPGGAWPENAHSAAIVPIWLATDKNIPDAFLVLGLSPRQDFDEAYRSFAERVAGILKDAFVRGKAYDAEKKSAEEHRATVDFAMNLVHEAVYLVDKDARILYTNDEAARALGYSREELLRMRVSGIDPDYPPEQWVRHFGDMSVARSGTFESRHKTKDGRIFPVEVSTNYFEYEGNAYIMGLVRDISERKRAEEERLRPQSSGPCSDAPWTGSMKAAYLIGTDGRFLYVNGEACRALGYSRDELIGMSVQRYRPRFPGGSVAGLSAQIRHRTLTDFRDAPQNQGWPHFSGRDYQQHLHAMAARITGCRLSATSPSESGPRRNGGAPRNSGSCWSSAWTVSMRALS